MLNVDPQGTTRFADEATLKYIAELEDALQFYADRKNWRNITDGWKQFMTLATDEDMEYFTCQTTGYPLKVGGKRARQALQPKEAQDD